MVNQISTKMLRLFRRQFIDEYCNSESLSQVCALDNHILERVANVNESILLERHNTNNHIIKLVRKRSEINDQLEGFYILYPVNSECEKLIEDGTILKSRQMTTCHICKELGQAAPLYLSMVYGRTRQAQAYLIYLLYRDIRGIVRANRRVQAIYVRPVTAAGFQVVERHDFHQFRADSGIYRRVVTPEDVA